MFNTMVIVIAMAALSMIAWCFEASPFFDTLKRINDARAHSRIPKWAQSLKDSVEVIGALSRLSPLILDVAVTLALTWVFGLSGLFGTMMGLTMSNVLSCVILWRTRRRPATARSR